LDELMHILPPISVVPAAPRNAHQSSEELAVALQLIQLMEDVFMDLQLDDFWEHPDNRGWAIMFMRWARSPRFRSYWNQIHRTFGIRFEYFCTGRLGLTRDTPIVRV
jgi:steroid 5-alpha reductase family enzyme